MTQGSSPVRRRPPRVLYRVLNPLFRFILRSPLHGLLSGRLMLLTFTGRKSGKRCTIPVGYAQTNDTLFVGTGFPWQKNLRGGAPVRLRLRGRECFGTSEVITDETEMAETYRVMLAVAPSYGRAIGLPPGPDGEPSPEDVARLRGEGT